ncbi:MAG: hypothetical protein ACKOWQ_01630 [Aquirufa sp.]
MNQNLKQEIVNKQENPAELEQLYQSNKSAFKSAFLSVYTSLKDQSIAEVWHQRLTYQSNQSQFGEKKDWLMLGVFAIIAGFLMQLPRIFDWDQEFYYPRNIGFFAFPLVASYFASKYNFNTKPFKISLVIIAISAIYINLLPNVPTSNTLILASIHLPIFIWTLVGFNFVGHEWKSSAKRMDFLRYNGNLLIMTALLMLAGGIFTALTLGLFKVIDLPIEKWYFDYFVLSAIPSVPILATFLIQNNPQLVSKISPIIAKIFTPLVFITLLGFLIALIFSGKDPYNDRDFLMVFNVILLGVMALILFSISEASKEKISSFQLYTLTGLAILAIINNAIALSAIGFRLFEFGFTPNRIAVLGSNILIMINLVLVGKSLIQICQSKKQVSDLEKSLTSLFEFYVLWTIFVIFVIPFVFQFR